MICRVTLALAFFAVLGAAPAFADSFSGIAGSASSYNGRLASNPSSFVLSPFGSYNLSGNESVSLTCGDSLCPVSQTVNIPGLGNVNLTSANSVSVPISTFANSSLVSQQFASVQTQLNQISKQLQDSMRSADQGTAMAIAMSGAAFLLPDETVAFAPNAGLYNGQTALGISGSYRIADHVSLNGGFAAAPAGGRVAGRAGFRFGW